MSDSEDEDSSVCPLCVEEMDLSDKNFLPCPCGYRVCMWCWHHIRENLNGLCPACRTPYNSDPHAFSAVDRQEIVKKNRERKQREKHDKKVSDKPSVTPKTGSSIDRKHLHNYRVVQRNLVYIIGLPLSSANEELLRKAEYFGQYGKIIKVVVHRNQSISQSTVSAYVTFGYKEDAKAAIHALDNFVIEGHQLRASFGTTKYCNNFIRNVPCNNPECVYLHDLGDEDDRFTKEEIQAGHTKLIPTPGKDQSIVTGCGGPSGTGRRPIADPILPPPVFIQDNPVPSISKASKNGQHPSGFGLIVDLTKDEEIVSSNGSSKVVFQKVGKPETALDKAPSAASVHSVKNVEGQLESGLQLSSSSPSDTNDNIHEQLRENAHVRTLSSENANCIFNGVTWNAVFPVPTSSLSSPLWSAILRVSHSNLQSNPFHQSKLTVADIMELTLPPVDAASIVPWPKPPGYYMNSMISTDGSENEDKTSIKPLILASAVSFQNTVSSESGKNSGGNSFTALRQLFPGVNLTYGATPAFPVASNGQR